MSMSDDRPVRESPAIARRRSSAAAAATDRRTPPRSELVDVMFPLVDDEEWPPYPAEMIDAVLIAHDLAEIRGIPWFVTNVSRGDIVQVRHDGIGYVGGAIVSRGGHSTVHVMATSEDELAPIVRASSGPGRATPQAAWCRRC